MQFGHECFCLKMEQGDGIACELPAQTGMLDQFTLMLWFQISDDNTIKSLITQENGIDIGIEYDTLYVSFGSQREVSKPILLKNIWNHLAVVLYDSGIEVFLNGASILLKDFSNAALSASFLTIGKGYFGYIRNVALYKTALITDEIQYMMYHEEDTKPILINCDFTSNPPMERVSGKSIPLSGRTQIISLAPSAVFDNFAYFHCIETNIRPWLDINRAFTLQAWLRFSPSELQDYHVVFSDMDMLYGGGIELGISRGENGCKVCVYLGTTDVPFFESNSILPAESWQNIALVCSENTLKLYLDGLLDGAKKVESQPKVSGKGLMLIGARGSAAGENGSFWYHGAIARFDVWKAALTQQEIMEYADENPIAAEDRLLASWDFLETNVINTVSGTPLRKVDSARVTHREETAAPHTCEKQPVLRSLWDAVPELPPEMIQKARIESGIMEYRKRDDFHQRATLVTSCCYQETIYFLCHDINESYPVASIDGDTDEVTVWCIELVLIIISGIISYFLALKINYSSSLAQYIRRHILPSPATRYALAQIVSTGDVSISSLMTLVKDIICSGKISPILKMACNCGFWLVLSFVVGISRRFLYAGTDIAIWLGILVAQVVLHIARFPEKKAFSIQLEEILFCHDTPEKICSIHIRKNFRETWALPEWVNGRDEQSNAPAVYRLARFSKNSNVLEIKAALRTVNDSKETKYYEVQAVGGEPFGTSAVQKIACPPGNTLQTVYFKFNDAKSLFEKNGIMRYDLTLSWEFREADTNTDPLEFVRFQLSKHRIYAILDSVNPPWGAAAAEFNNNGHPVKLYTPMTELYDKTIDMVRGILTPDEAKKRIEASLYNSGKFKYQGGSSMGLSEMIYPLGYEDFLNYTDDNPFDVNCQDCTILMISIANLYGCNLKYAVQHLAFKLAETIKLIGEDQERMPNDECYGLGWFSHHYISVDGSLNQNDPRQLACYDPCFMYHGRTDQSLRLASGVQLSAFQVPGPQAVLPQTESYLECVMENSNEGTGQYNIQGHNGPLYFLNM